MILSEMEKTNATVQARLLLFLQEDLGIPATVISEIMQSNDVTTLVQSSGTEGLEHPLSLLPMLLWQHRVITLNQVAEIFAWLKPYHRLAAA